MAQSLKWGGVADITLFVAQLLKQLVIRNGGIRGTARVAVDLSVTAYGNFGEEPPHKIGMHPC